MDSPPYIHRSYSFSLQHNHNPKNQLLSSHCFPKSKETKITTATTTTVLAPPRPRCPPPSYTHLSSPQISTMNLSPSSSQQASSLMEKSAMWEQEPPSDSDMDELLSVFGYKIESTDMAEVAQKLKQVMSSVHQEDGISETVQSQSCPDSIFDFTDHHQKCTQALVTCSVFDDLCSSDHDLDNEQDQIFDSTHQNKRLKLQNPSHDLYPFSNLSDSQANEIRLVHVLMACALAIQQDNLNLAEALVKQTRVLAFSQTGVMRKVATYFTEALARKIYRLCSKDPLDDSLSNVLRMHFYQTFPYLKFAHFTANQAILEAFEGKKRVHVIDFSMNEGMQWPALMQALALRPGGPPVFRLTGISQPASDNHDHLQEVGWKLAKFAETIHIQFEFRGFAANSLADLNESMLQLSSSETESVAVNSVFELHKLLARPGGAMEKVLSVVKRMKPVIFTIVEQEVNHNGPGFVDWFTESLHYYSTLFDSLEWSSVNDTDKVMSEVYLGKQICKVVACEGVDRVRHEKLTQWRNRLDSAGFVSAHLGSNALKKASLLLALYDGDDWFEVEENGSCLMLGWHTRPLVAASAWKLGGDSPS